MKTKINININIAIPILLCLFLLFTTSCDSGSAFDITREGPPCAGLCTQWAKTVVSGSNYSWFESVAVDSSGNVYAAGFINGTSEINFGNGQTATGVISGDSLLLVKYNSSGVAQWAKTVTSGSNSSRFYSVAVDSSGNVYAAGYINGTTAYDFGNSQTATGSYSGNNILLVKYNSSGLAQWAKTVDTGSLSSIFYSVSVDGSGNVYAAGYINGTTAYDFGNSQTATGSHSSNNILLVKYNSSGVAQWAKTVISGSNSSWFRSVSVDSIGNVYAAGSISGTTAFDFGNSQTATGSYSSNNILLVKYNSSGVAQWAKTVDSSSSYSEFYSVAVDGSGNVYAAGYIAGTTAYDFGNSQTATGSYSSNNILLVKYNSSGVTQWAKTVTSGSNNSQFQSVVVDSSGNLYAAGYIKGTGEFNLGNDQIETGTFDELNILLVKYNSSGVTQKAKTISSGSDSSVFFSVSVDSSGNVYAAGYIYGTTEFDFGDDQTATGANGTNNIILVKYSN